MQTKMSGQRNSAQHDKIRADMPREDTWCLKPEAVLRAAWNYLFSLTHPGTPLPPPASRSGEARHVRTIAQRLLALHATRDGFLLPTNWKYRVQTIGLNENLDILEHTKFSLAWDIMTTYHEEKPHWRFRLKEFIAALRSGVEPKNPRAQPVVYGESAEPVAQSFKNLYEQACAYRDSQPPVPDAADHQVSIEPVRFSNGGQSLVTDVFGFPKIPILSQKPDPCHQPTWSESFERRRREKRGENVFPPGHISARIWKEQHQALRDKMLEED